MDQAAIYSLSLKKKGSSFSAFKEKESFTADKKLIEKKLLEASALLHGLSYSILWGGVVFYAASLQKSINIYFIPARGIIPKEKNIDEQYELSRRYLLQNEKRYFMAQEAVLDYHKGDPKYTHYETQLLLDSIGYHRKKNNLGYLSQLKKKIEEDLTRKPYLAFCYGLYMRKQADPEQVLPYLLDFQKKHFISKLPLLSPQEAEPLQAALKYKLAEEYKRLGYFSKALAEIKSLNSNYPNYPFRQDALFFQAEIEYSLDQESSMLVFNAMAKDARIKAKPERLESIHKRIYELYAKKSDLKQLDKKIQIKRKYRPLDPLIRDSLELLQAQQYMQEAKYEEALSLTLRVQARIPKHKAAFRFLPNEGYSGLYTNSWRIAEECYRRLGKQDAAFAALIEIVGSYNKEVKLELGSLRFTELIDHTSQQIDSYLTFARSLSQKYRLAKQAVDKGLSLGSQKKEYIGLSATQALDLDKLCGRLSQSNIIFQRLSSKYARLYINFCEKNGKLLKQAREPRLLVQEVYKAVDILYAIAYSHARILNFLFFNMRRLGFLEEVYNKNSVHFRRLEVDIVAEQSEELVGISEQNVILDLFLGESDSYNSEGFSGIERNYRLLFKQAIFAHDLSLLYAYAYMFIKKNISRESFYAALEKRGQNFSPSLLQYRKKESLHDLKNAEYLLRYILNVDPQYVDAYLLLGWLFQYVDQGKKNIVKYRANIWERITGEHSNVEQDKDFYEDIYEIYFPDNYYEENVDLYLKALQRMEGFPSAKESSGHLHLNLANNYFILSNFKEAAKHYRKVLLSFDDQESSGNRFESRKQEILFYFNFARTLIYENRYEQAIVYLKKCYRLYEEKEYPSLKGDYGRLQFILNSRARQSLPPDLLGQHLVHFKNVEMKFKKTRERLALIAALTGLAHWQAGNSKKAIFYYHKANYHLYKEKPELPEVLSRSNLLNFLALAYQDRGQLEDADHYAAIAAQNAQKAGLGRGEERYQVKGYCGRGLGCFLKFGEDFSVVGKGRNPYGFAPLRQYELSLGIQLENMIRRDQFSQADALIKKQRQVFHKHELDLKHGQIGYLNTLNKEALTNYRAGNYQKAADAFLKAAKQAREFSNMESYRINYANYFNSLLSRLEYDPPKPAKALEQIENVLEEWDDFEGVYREEIRNTFIREKRSEFYAYSFDEKRDGVFLEDRIQEGLGYMLALKANFFYYDSYFRDQEEASTASLEEEEKKQAIRKEAISLLKGVLENIKDKGSSLNAFAISCRYNLARLYFAGGQLYLARDVLEEAIRESYEAHLFREEILSRLLANQVYEELYTIYRLPEDEERSFYHMETLLELFFSKPYHYESLQREADKIIKSAANFYIKRGDDLQALQILEQGWMLYLNWQYFRYRVAFREASHEKLHESIAMKRRFLKALDERKYRLRLERKKTSELDAAGEKLQRELRLSLASLAKLSPKHSAFLSLKDWKAAAEWPHLLKGQVLMRFFVGPRSLPVLWCFSSETRRFFSYSESASQLASRSISSSFWNFSKEKVRKPYEKSVSSLIEKCIVSQAKGQTKVNVASKNISDIFLILTEELSSLNFYHIIKNIDPQLEAPIFAVRLSEELLGRASPVRKLSEKRALYLFNAGSVLPLLSPYISSGIQEAKFRVSGHTLSKLWKRDSKNKAVFSHNSKIQKGDIVEVLEKNLNLTLLLLKKENDRHSYTQTALLYEILRSYGLGTLAWEQKEDSIDLKKLVQIAGKGSYTQEGVRIFGFAGFEETAIQDLVSRKYAAFSLRANQAESEKQYGKAKQLHLLAASYLTWHPDALRLSQDKALALLRLQILLKPSIAHDNTIAKLLSLASQGEGKQKEASEGNKDFEIAVYKTAIHALSESNASEASLQYLREYQKRFPSSQTESSGLEDALTFRSRLSQSRYVLENTERASFSLDFAKAYPYLKKQRDLQIVEQLVKHSQYDAAQKLLEDWQRDTKETAFRAKLGDWELSILFARFLLEGLRPDFSLPIFSPLSMKARSPYLQMLYAAWQGDWKEYAKLSKRLQALFEKKKQDSLSHIYLYTQWQNFLKQHDLDLTRLNEIQQVQEKAPYIKFLERSLIHHLLTHSLDMDGANQNALFLDSFIKEERQESSVNRMAEMALYAAQKYIERGDFFHALHFFDLYLKAEKDSIFVKRNAYPAARIGTMLDSMGLRPEFIKYQKQWQENLETRFPRGNFIVGLFQGLNHGSLKSKIKHLKAHVMMFSEMVSTGVFQNSKKKSQESSVKNSQKNLQGDSVGAIVQDLDIALNFLQWQALLKEEWSILVNLAFFKEDLSYFRTSYSKAKVYSAPLYQDYFTRLQRKIPSQQNFIALIDTNNVILRFVLRKGEFHILPLDQSAQSLGAKMNKYLRQRAMGLASYQKIQGELSTFYNNILRENLYREKSLGKPGKSEAHLSELSYIWLPGLHSLAPLYPRKGERFFQVLNLSQFIEYPVLANGRKLKPNFNVELVGERHLDVLHKAERYLADRVYTMEKFLFSSRLKKQAELPEGEHGFSKIYHIFTALNNSNRDNFAVRLLELEEIEKSDLRYSPWFVSSNFLKTVSPEQVASYNYFLRKLSYSFQAPGIMLLQKPSHLGHAYFVRSFYDENNPLRDIAARFANAYYLARQGSPKELDKPNYRLFTSSFLAN